MIKSYHNWSTTPGNFDKLNIMHLFKSSNKFGIPDVLRQDYDIQEIEIFNAKITPKNGLYYHFFTDDYRFENVWFKRKKFLTKAKRLMRLIAPDFSIYSNMPEALQIFNTYRNRYITRYWQDNGIKVIPCVSWGFKNTYKFCFEGIPLGSVVAISSIGIRKRQIKTFRAGYRHMIDKIKPSKIICYGNKFINTDFIHKNTIFLNTFWNKN